mmetsp:Transcript_21238/g.48826  ORF Transcript_21238/g.48826 Transcript_21238/m.48826 type:complete len:320 (+) Transcript_21238:570-1529(+)
MVAIAKIGNTIFHISGEPYLQAQRVVQISHDRQRAHHTAPSQNRATAPGPSAATANHELLALLDEPYRLSIPKLVAKVFPTVELLLVRRIPRYALRRSKFRKILGTGRVDVVRVRNQLRLHGARLEGDPIETSKVRRALLDLFESGTATTEAALAVLGAEGLDQSPQHRRLVVRVLNRRLANALVDLFRVAATKGQLAAVEDINGDAESEPIRLDLVGLLPDHLGRPVAARARRLHDGPFGNVHGKPHVGDAHLPVQVEKDILRLKVTVDKPSLVDGLKPACNRGRVELENIRWKAWVFRALHLIAVLVKRVPLLDLKK